MSTMTAITDHRSSGRDTGSHSCSAWNLALILGAAVIVNMVRALVLIRGHRCKGLRAFPVPAPIAAVPMDKVYSYYNVLCRHR